MPGLLGGFKGCMVGYFWFTVRAIIMVFYVL